MLGEGEWPAGYWRQNGSFGSFCLYTESTDYAQLLPASSLEVGKLSDSTRHSLSYQVNSLWSHLILTRRLRRVSYPLLMAVSLQWLWGEARQLLETSPPTLWMSEVEWVESPSPLHLPVWVRRSYQNKAPHEDLSNAVRLRLIQKLQSALTSWAVPGGPYVKNKLGHFDHH